MGLIIKQIASEGREHTYWEWRKHKEAGARVDAWGPSDLPRCPTCYGTNGGSTVHVTRGSLGRARVKGGDRTDGFPMDTAGTLSEIFRVLPPKGQDLSHPAPILMERLTTSD